MSGFWGQSGNLGSIRALSVGPNCDADRYSSRPRNRLGLSTAFEAGRAEVLAWEQAASVPSAGITLQQTDTPFCRGQLAIAGSCAPAPDAARQRGSNGRPLMTHLIDKNLVER